MRQVVPVALRNLIFVSLCVSGFLFLTSVEARAEMSSTLGPDSPLMVAFKSSGLPSRKPVRAEEYYSRISHAILFIESDLQRQESETETLSKMIPAQVVERLGDRVPTRLKSSTQNELMANLDMARTVGESVDRNGRIRASGCRMRALFLAELLKRSGIPADSINIVETVNKKDLLTLCRPGAQPTQSFSGHTFISVKFPDGSRKMFNPTGGKLENNGFSGFEMSSENTGWQIPYHANPYGYRIGDVIVFRNLPYTKSSSYTYRERAHLILGAELGSVCTQPEPAVASSNTGRQ